MRVIYSNGLGVERAGAERKICVKDFTGEQGSLLICSFLLRAGTVPEEETAAERSRAETRLTPAKRRENPRPLTKF